jgi:Fe2+ transport system protein FeoA
VNAIVLFGDVIRSRRDAQASTAWLRTLVEELETAYPADQRLADFGFTQGDELQCLLAPAADPLQAVVRAWLHPGRVPMRWVAVHGSVDPGVGPATERTGPAFILARERLTDAAARRDRLLMTTGAAETDALLDDLAPLLPELLGDLTARQRVVGRLILVEGLRPSQAAERLDVSRATISVAADRAHLRSIGRLADALGRLFATGLESAVRAGTDAVPGGTPVAEATG